MKWKRSARRAEFDGRNEHITWTLSPESVGGEINARGTFHHHKCLTSDVSYTPGPSIHIPFRVYRKASREIRSLVRSKVVTDNNSREISRGVRHATTREQMQHLSRVGGRRHSGFRSGQKLLREHRRGRRAKKVTRDTTGNEKRRRR